jgi:hypothetical protein
MDLRTENTSASPAKLKSTLLSVTPHPTPTHTGALLFAVKQVALRPNLSSFRKGKKNFFPRAATVRKNQIGCLKIKWERATSLDHR